MSAKYLLTNDEDYLWSALIFPVLGCMFDFMDGKVARWRREARRSALSHYTTVYYFYVARAILPRAYIRISYS